jgi:hypothetical protein
MPPRSRAASAATAAAGASAPASIDPEDADLHFEGPVVMPRMNRSNLAKFQYLFIVISHNEVRQRGTLSVAEQQRLILAAYKRNIRLWYRNDATLISTPNLPVCAFPLSDYHL